VSFVGIDALGARTLGQELQGAAGRIDGVLRSVSAALNMADLSGAAPAQLALVQDGFTMLATGVADKAGIVLEPLSERPTAPTVALLPAPAGEDVPEDWLILAQAPGRVEPSTQRRITIAVVGNSFTSGEGADPRRFETRPEEFIDPLGNTIPIPRIDPAHRSATAPAMRIINELQAQNPGVTFDVRFVAVSGATRDSMYLTTNVGTPFEAPPQMDAVRGADVVILGIGGNDARFSDWASTVFWSTEATSEQRFPEFLEPVQSREFRQAQRYLYDDILARMNTNGTLLVTGYPEILPNTVPTRSPSPLSEMLISSREAELSNILTRAINDQLRDAATIAGDLWGSTRSVRYLDLTDALNGHRLFDEREGVNGVDVRNLRGSYHPNELGQGLLTDAMREAVRRAVLERLDAQTPSLQDNPQDGQPPAGPGNPLRRTELQAPEETDQVQEASAESERPADQQTAQLPGDGSYVDLARLTSGLEGFEMQGQATPARQDASWAAPADDGLGEGWVDAGLGLDAGGDWGSSGDWAA